MPTADAAVVDAAIAARESELRAAERAARLREGAVDVTLPAGGTAFKTPVGTFYPPNLTPDPETGIGKWTDLEFVNAVQRGISPEGENLIPAFPYTSYARMKTTDVLDIKAYLATLPAIKSPTKAHDVVALPIVLPPTVLGFYVLMAIGPLSPLGQFYESVFGHRL